MRASCPRLHIFWALACVLKPTRRGRARGRALQKGGFSPATTLPHILGTPYLQMCMNMGESRTHARAPRRVRVRNMRHYAMQPHARAVRWHSVALDHHAHADVAGGCCVCGFQNRVEFRTLLHKYQLLVSSSYAADKRFAAQPASGILDAGVGYS